MIQEWGTPIIRQKPSLSWNLVSNFSLSRASSVATTKHSILPGQSFFLLPWGFWKQFLITRLKLWPKTVDFGPSIGWPRFILLVFRHLIQESKLRYSQLRKQISRGSMWGAGEEVGLVQPEEEKGWKISTADPSYVMVWCRENRDKLFSEVYSNWTKGNRQKLQKQKFQSDFRKCFFTMRMVKYWSRYWRGGGIFVFGDIQNSTRKSSEQHSVTGYSLSGGLDKRTSRHPFQPQFSYGSTVLWVCRTSQILIKSQSHPVKLPFTVYFKKFDTNNFHTTNNEFFSLLTSLLKFNFVSGGNLFIV